MGKLFSKKNVNNTKNILLEKEEQVPIVEVNFKNDIYPSELGDQQFEWIPILYHNLEIENIFRICNEGWKLYFQKNEDDQKTCRIDNHYYFFRRTKY